MQTDGVSSGDEFKKQDINAKRCSFPNNKKVNGHDFFSVLQGAISTLQAMKTDEVNNYYTVEPDKSPFEQNGMSREPYLILPNLKNGVSSRNKNGLYLDSNKSPVNQRRQSLMAFNSSRSSASSVTVEAQTPSTQFWNNPAPPADSQLQIDSAYQTTTCLSLPRIDAKTSVDVSRMPRFGGQSVDEPVRRCKSMTQSLETMSDIRAVQARWRSRNSQPTGSKRATTRKHLINSSKWRIEIHKRKPPFG